MSRCDHSECRKSTYTQSGYARQRHGCGYETRSAKAATCMLRDLELLGDDSRVRIERTFAGYHDRSAGAWSWVAKAGRREVAGSQWPLATILKAHRETVVSQDSSVYGDIHLFPED